MIGGAHIVAPMPAQPRPDWEALARRCLPHLEALLAQQGDHAEPELISLQHELALLCRPTS